MLFFVAVFWAVNLEVRCIPCNKVVDDCHISTGFHRFRKKTFGKPGNGRQLNIFTADVWRSLLNVIFDAKKVEIDN